MRKFAVFSGFLGSGKTTTMMALTEAYNTRRGKAAMISNDLGKQSLADNKFAKLAGCNASELTGNCICYMTEALTRRLDTLFEEDGCDLVVCDIPGFGIGALDHVYHTLNRDYPGRYSLAPFTVLAEPAAVARLRAGETGDLAYILRAQLLEADLIVLNKCDLIGPDEREANLSWLGQQYPHARVIAISALTGAGLEALCDILEREQASMHLPDTGYGGPAFCSAMGKMSEYYIQYYAEVCCRDFDANRYLLDMAAQVQRQVKALGGEIPHLKLLAWEPEGDYGKVDLLGVDRPAAVTRAFSAPATELAVMLNASAACPGEELGQIMGDVIRQISEEYNLTCMTFREECFGMGQ